MLTDDYARMKLSTVQNSGDLANLATILDQNSYTSNHYFNTRLNKTSSATVTLTEGYYYFEVFTLNGGGPGYYKIGVSTPELLPEIINPTWALD